MAKARVSDEETGGGLSLLPQDAVETGLFQGGRCSLSFIFGEYDYKGRGRFPSLIVTFTDENGEKHEEPYGVGQGWKISKDGTQLIPRNGQRGLPKSCDSILYMFGPLAKALADAGGELPASLNTDITVLDGIVADVERRETIAREFKNNKPRPGQDDQKRRPSTKLVVTTVITAPWDDTIGEGASDTPAPKGKGGKDARSAKAEAVTGSKTRKPAPVDEDDDEDEDDEPAPAPKGKAAAKGGKAAPAAKGKAAAVDTDDDEDAEDADEDETDETDEIGELAGETLIELLEAESPLAVEDLPEQVLEHLKGSKQRKAVAERVQDEDFLETERGWSFDAKKGTIAIKKARRR